ncbi:MAG: hypothetical protein K2V38_14390 [Gemmataceae bacterium]|nr:hypothetical protein [Gemmataceae bacterium]
MPKKPTFTASVEDGHLVVRLPLDPDPQPSSTGKTLIAASTRGVAPLDCGWIGQRLRLSATAFVYPPPDYKPKSETE